MFYAYGIHYLLIKIKTFNSYFIFAVQWSRKFFHKQIQFYSFHSSLQRDQLLNASQAQNIRLLQVCLTTLLCFSFVTIESFRTIHQIQTFIKFFKKQLNSNVFIIYEEFLSLSCSCSDTFLFVLVSLSLCFPFFSKDNYRYLFCVCNTTEIDFISSIPWVLITCNSVTNLIFVI